MYEKSPEITVVVGKTFKKLKRIDDHEQLISENKSCGAKQYVQGPMGTGAFF